MPESMEELAQASGRRRCLECARSFRPRRSHQQYCSEKHRRTALLRRRRARESIQAADPVPEIRCAELLEAAQAERERMGLPRLQVDRFLEMRALELEAEAQVKLWTERLRARREAILHVPDPGAYRAVKRLEAGEPLLVPDAAQLVGLASTDGRVGFVVYGSVK